MKLNYITWKDDAKAKSKLIKTINQIVTYTRCKNYSWVVDKIKIEFNISRKISSLHSLIWKSSENCDWMVAYMAQIVETEQKLHGTSFNSNDKGIGSLLLLGLSDKFSQSKPLDYSVISNVVDSIKSKLLGMEIDGSKTSNAFKAGYIKAGWHSNKQRSVDYSSK